MATTASASRSTAAHLLAGMSTSPASSDGDHQERRAATGRTSVFQCGWRTATDSSPTASERS